MNIIIAKQIDGWLFKLERMPQKELKEMVNSSGLDVRRLKSVILYIAWTMGWIKAEDMNA